jgi:hypothetical protein
MPVEGRWFAMYVYTETPTIDLEKSELNETVLPHLDNRKIYTLTTLRPECRIVDPQAAEGRHLWRDEVTKNIFCDGRFKRAVEERLPDSGISFETCMAWTDTPD